MLKGSLQEILVHVNALKIAYSNVPYEKSDAKEPSILKRWEK